LATIVLRRRKKFWGKKKGRHCNEFCPGGKREKGKFGEGGEGGLLLFTLRGGERGKERKGKKKKGEYGLSLVLLARIGIREGRKKKWREKKTKKKRKEEGA